MERKAAVTDENNSVVVQRGAWGSVLVGRSRDRSQVVSLGIFSVALPEGTMCSGVDSAPENEYQGFLLG
jgi:hypothetical protein